jgi:hypothetical protein
MATIELYGREVVPRVRELLAESAEEWASGSQNAATAAASSSGF